MSQDKHDSKDIEDQQREELNAAHLTNHVNGVVDFSGRPIRQSDWKDMDLTIATTTSTAELATEPPYQEAAQVSLGVDNDHDGQAEQDPDLQAAIRLSLMTDLTESSADNDTGVWCKQANEDRSEDIGIRALQLANRLALVMADPEDDTKQSDFELARELALFEEDTRLDELFIYEPLLRTDEIRLLRIDTRSAMHGRMEYSLVITSLNDPMLSFYRYSTLSYDWGQTFPDGSHLDDIIICNGSPLKVTKNLSQALFRIRETRQNSDESLGTGAMYLWVDSICINQADPAERNRQVELMADIYARCHDMIVWLGEHSEDAIDWLKTSASLFPNMDVSARYQSGHNSLQSWINTSDGGEIVLSAMLEALIGDPCVEAPCFSLLRRGLLLELHSRGRRSIYIDVMLQALEQAEPTWRAAYSELTKRAWFRRKWVIQEVAQTSEKPREFLLADKVFGFEDMVEPILGYSLVDTASPLVAIISNRSLQENLAQYRNTECSSPHDHIYALLGLNNDAFWVNVDYNCNVNDLYVSIAKFYVSIGNYEAILALATIKKSALGMPSWVPDWREPSCPYRSLDHSDAMRTLSVSSSRFFRDNASTTRPLFTSQQSSGTWLGLQSWIIARCDPPHFHDSTHCNRCKLLKVPKVGDVAHKVKQQSDQNVRSPSTTTASHRLLTARKVASTSKWASIILQQFDSVMSSNEVLCLLRGSPLGFVLSVVAAVESTQELPTYRLEYFFRVDEEGWLSNWFGAELGEDSQEWIWVIRSFRFAALAAAWGTISPSAISFCVQWLKNVAAMLALCPPTCSST